MEKTLSTIHQGPGMVSGLTGGQSNADISGRGKYRHDDGALKNTLDELFDLQGYKRWLESLSSDDINMAVLEAANAVCNMTSVMEELLREEALEVLAVQERSHSVMVNVTVEKAANVPKGLIQAGAKTFVKVALHGAQTVYLPYRQTKEVIAVKDVVSKAGSDQRTSKEDGGHGHGSPLVSSGSPSATLRSKTYDRSSVNTSPTGQACQSSGHREWIGSGKSRPSDDIPARKSRTSEEMGRGGGLLKHTLNILQGRGSMSPKGSLAESAGHQAPTTPQWGQASESRSSGEDSPVSQVDPFDLVVGNGGGNGRKATESTCSVTWGECMPLKMVSDPL